MLSFLNPLESSRETVKLLDVLEPVSHEFRHVEPAGNHNSRRWPCVCRRGNLSTTYSRHTCPWWRYEYLSPLRTEISPKWGQQFCTSCCWIKDATIKARCLMSTTRKEGIIVNTWIGILLFPGWDDFETGKYTLWLRPKTVRKMNSENQLTK